MLYVRLMGNAMVLVLLLCALFMVSKGASSCLTTSLTQDGFHSSAYPNRIEHYSPVKRLKQGLASDPSIITCTPSPRLHPLRLDYSITTNRFLSDQESSEQMVTNRISCHLVYTRFETSTIHFSNADGIPPQISIAVALDFIEAIWPIVLLLCRCFSPGLYAPSVKTVLRQILIE